MGNQLVLEIFPSSKQDTPSNRHLPMIAACVSISCRYGNYKEKHHIPGCQTNDALECQVFLSKQKSRHARKQGGTSFW